MPLLSEGFKAQLSAVYELNSKFYLYDLLKLALNNFS